MKRDYEYLISRLDELYKIYENYAWSTKDRKLTVVFQETPMISFYLYDKNYLIDEFNISFDEKEKNVYEYFSLSLFITMLGNVKIHHFCDDIYHNPYRKPYLLVSAKNKDVYAYIEELIKIQETENINRDSKPIKDVKNKMKPRYIDEGFVNQLNKRIDISDKMLRSYHK